MSRFKIPLLITIATLSLFLVEIEPIAAHSVDYHILDARGTTLGFEHPDGTPLADVEFEIKGPGDTAYFQQGRTDRLGRLSFLPDRHGQWTIKLFSDDGHGMQTVIDITDDLQILRPKPHLLGNRFIRILAGLLFIALCFFALRSLQIRKYS